MKIVNVDEMRRIEQATDGRGQSYASMMDMAGHAVAQAASTLILRGPAKHVLVLVGPGNNGGDGLVAARYMLQEGAVVTVYLWKRDIKGDKNFQQLKRAGRRRGLDILWADNDADFGHLREQLQVSDILIDALLGTGASRPIEGKLAEILGIVREEIQVRRQPAPVLDGPDLIHPLLFPVGEAYTLGLMGPNRSFPSDEDEWDDAFDEDWDEVDRDDDLMMGDELDDYLDDGDDFDEDGDSLVPRWPALPVLAVDCPSGLNSDTGELDPATITAQLTVTFGYPKWGQLQYPGAGACGVLAVADIGVPPDLADEVQVDLVGPAEVARWLPGRPVDANKGTFGKALLVAGSLNYTGAAYLCGASAGRAGAGLVTLAIPTPLHTALAAALPEATWLPLPSAGVTLSPEGVGAVCEHLAGYRALLVGPGITTEPAARDFLGQFFSPDGLPTEDWRGRFVADADCLNILSGWPDWPSRLPPESILTPHPGEMARLTGMSIADINRERIATARRWAAEWGHIVLLKGAHTVVAAPGGRAAVLPFATPALATAGSGDVLAGSIVAMIAQGLPPYEAAICGAYLHGHAGLIAQREIGISGVVASDILARLPKALRQLWRL